MGVNRVSLQGNLTFTETLRHTPAGLPVLNCRLQHSGMQMEAGMERRVSCDVNAVAIGDIALQIARLAPGTALNISGFLASTSNTRADSRLILHITNFE